VTSVESVPGRRKASYNLIFTLRPDRRRRESTANHFADNHANDWHPEPPPDLDTRAVDLTPRQLEVLRQLSEGRSTQEVADSLGISVNTVRNHIQNTLAKLGVHSQVEAVAKAIRRRQI
jgi:DNA-binding CsgD family transcriptional regulator